MYEQQYFESRIPEFKDYIIAMQWLEYLSTQGVIEQVLDYGCGAGKFVHIFNYFGLEATGYDPHLPEKTFGLSERNCYSDLNEIDCNFDLITMIDVMEHIPEDKVEEVIMQIMLLSPRWIIASICDVTLWDVYKDETHITCKSKEWWINQFEKQGARYIKPPQDWWYRNQMYVFEVKNV